MRKCYTEKEAYKKKKLGWSGGGEQCWWCTYSVSQPLWDRGPV